MCARVHVRRKERGRVSAAGAERGRTVVWVRASHAAAPRSQAQDDYSCIMGALERSAVLGKLGRARLREIADNMQRLQIGPEDDKRIITQGDVTGASSSAALPAH